MSDDVEPTTPPAPPTPGPPTAARGADDAAEVAALRAIGLDLLFGDEEGGGARWSDVEDRARRAGRRRSWIAAVAAAVVLVLAVGAGALLARAGRESSTPAGPGGEPRYVLPPVDAENVGAYATLREGAPSDAPAGSLPAEAVHSYNLTWTEPSSGEQLILSVIRPSDIVLGPVSSTPGSGFDVPQTAGSLADLVQRVWRRSVLESRPLTSGDASGLDPATVTCLSTPPEGSADVATGVLDGAWVVSLLPDGREPGGCTEDAEDGTAVRRGIGQLRLVDEAEWWAFVQRWGRVETATAPTTTPPTTLDPAVSAYCDAIERYRGTGLTDPGTGAPSAEALPYIESIRDAAPDDVRPTFDVVVSWLAAGAPAPMPEDVRQAMLPMTQDWISRCQGGPG
jgi:hypothetical protein